MSSIAEIAMTVFPSFSSNVLERRRATYSWYADDAGLDPARDGLLIGKAMHFIGGLCLAHQVPVAPLHWVRRGDGRRSEVFKGEDEARLILEPGDLDLLTVVAREYIYSEEELSKVGSTLEAVATAGPSAQFSHRTLWRILLTRAKPGAACTRYEVAVARYRDLLGAMRRSRLREA